MALKRLASNDVLGNDVAHFFKSGNIIRGEESNSLASLRDLLPTNGPNGTRVEYDVWYDVGDRNKIHGYVYTDAMAKFVYIRTANTHQSHKIMKEAAKTPITDEGLRIFEDIAKNSCDKYRLRKARKTHSFVIFLPGTNIINDVLNWEKVERAVKQGAKLKCHPLTAPPLVANLKHRFGAENIIDKKLSGHDLLSAASIVGCCENSEMGIVALASSKTVYLFGQDQRHLTYSALYSALWENDKPSIDKLKRMLSCTHSGLIPIIAKNPKEYIENFFNYYKDLVHVSPRNPNP